MPDDRHRYWNADGTPACFLVDDDIFSPRGEHLGHRDGNEVFTLDGRYLGELVDDRIVRRTGVYRRIGATARRAHPAAALPPAKPPLRPSPRGRTS
ncbi:4-fold beta flower protein [Actinoplanes sp. NPDC049316]|uniref:4-fold beta flower protein n=1 Tax=Actinoplanes sp. NPDC049316 TaxID=3154727 RepID=UPI0034349323